ncbi:Rgg/GadR/MutR family transcriptional regulator [Lactococcus lactis]|uniref:Rgg/GadR/MutR family transcriptional regulator n=1 Tax=Lactococcus lactis TaxID=1358 RepID=A0A9X4S5B6_9LACT|nr:Rgg/GadR/MutR family transcriptional regulator [Lactococcus lactis]MDG4984965.1 Rgg/GadR/MutR family transcriptional regulator [Lactococcus lactis]
MIYRKYGETFRRIREQSHLSLSDFSSIGISKGALSNFERGKSMMNFEKVTSALQIMGVSLEDFEAFLNDYSLNEPDFLIQEIEKATAAEDKNQLLKLIKVSENQNFSHIALAAKSSLRVLTTEEIEEITDYLYEIDIWSYRELCIFYLTMENLSTRDILYILDLFLAPGHSFLNSRKYQGYLLQACCRAVTVFSSRGYREYGEYILNKIEQYELVNSMFLRNLRNITRGYWIYCFVDKEEGNQLMLSALSIFEAVSTPDNFNYYKHRYEKLVKKLNN